jgi:hypothetical protein
MVEYPTAEETRMTKQQAKRLGRQLDAYMQFRAEREGVGYNLTPVFYEAALLKGAVAFFGISFANGEIVGDIQNPTADLTPLSACVPEQKFTAIASRTHLVRQALELHSSRPAVA